jgi:probable phosphoglycerate mutase
MEATEKSRRRIYLMRHGDVSYFDATGRPFKPATVPLNEEGRSQAHAAARELASIPFDRVVSSNLIRSVETATIVTNGRQLAVETCADLREIQPGKLADIPADGIAQAFLGAFANGTVRETQFLGGETFGSLADRVAASFRRFVAERGWRHLLLVAHGGVNRVILAHALGLGLDGFGAIEQDAGCINIIDVSDDGRCLVRLVNHTPYNPTKAGMELTTMESLYQQYCRRVGAAAKGS